MCTEKIKIELDFLDYLLVEQGLLLYESRLFDSLIALSPEESGSCSETFLLSQLESVKKLWSTIHNKEMCYGY